MPALDVEYGKLSAVVIFSGAGYSFDRSPELRARLLAAIDHMAAPVFFIHARTTTLSRQVKCWMHDANKLVNRIA